MSRARGAVVFFVFVFFPFFAVSAAEAVTLEQAREIALSRTAVGGAIVETEIDRRVGGGFVYEFEIIDGGAKFEIKIDGSTGGVLEFSREDRRSPGIVPNSPRGAGARMTSEAAQKIALEEAGGGAVTRYKLDRDDGRYVHEVTVVRDDKRYKFEIDDGSGVVGELSVKQRNR